MDGFDDSSGLNGSGLEEADPAAEFLAREQSNLAGLEDDIPPAAVVTNGISERTASPINDPSERSVSPSITASINSVPAQEPEKIRIWREEQKQRLEVKGV